MLEAMTSTPPPAAGVPFSRGHLVALLFGTLAALVTGTALLLPPLRDELARLEPWQRAVFFVGDATALFWFLAFSLRHGLRGVPLRTLPARGPLDGRWYLVLLSLFLGLGLDLACTLALKGQEERAHARGVIVEATAEAVECARFPRLHHHLIRCRFAAATGETLRVRLALYEEPGAGFEPGVPERTVAALRRGEVPFAFPVRYDPLWPHRCWPEGGAAVDDNSATYFSFALHCCQFAAILIFAALLAKAQEEGIRPWWSGLHAILPLLTEAGFLLLAGSVRWAAG
jgi:hypothetical protein